jgi:hypothetical protein
LARALPSLTKPEPGSQVVLRSVHFNGDVSAARPSSRLAPARRRVRLLKAASAGLAVAGFGLLSLAVRGAHTGGTGSSTPATSGGLDVSSRISQEAAQSGSFFDSGSVGPPQSSSPPQASTQTS